MPREPTPLCSWATATTGAHREGQGASLATVLPICAAARCPSPYATLPGTLRPTTWPYGRTAAFAPGSKALSGLPQSGCGACFEVQALPPGDSSGAVATSAPRGSSTNTTGVVVTVFDSCPGCQDSALALSPSAFNTLTAGNNSAAIAVRYRQVRRARGGREQGGREGGRGGGGEAPGCCGDLCGKPC